MKNKSRLQRSIITFGRIISTGGKNFFRNAWLAIAAIAVMSITLTIVLFSLVANASYSNTIRELTDKIDVSVYLKDTITAQQKDDLLKQLHGLPTVKSVQYLSKDDALAAYREQYKDNIN